MIHAIVFSYKNKNLKRAVDQLIKNTKNPIFVSIVDQNNLDRKETFLSLGYSENVDYEHVFWDTISSPIEHKERVAEQTTQEYFLQISDDILVKEHWDVALIDFLKNKKAIVSGVGQLSLKKDNLFFFKQDRSFSSNFTESGFIDRNFVFGKTESLKGTFPSEVKYRGEEELMSLYLYNLGIKVYSAANGLYEDIQSRTIENKYVPFSLNHNYNIAIREYGQAPANFLKLININIDDLYELPYPTNDVSYDPYSMAFQNMDGKKFLENVNSIF
jgi:hypothetical protein